MPTDPILTIGDLEPERHTIRVRRNAPDGWWQDFKHRHFDVLLRWPSLPWRESGGFPVRYTWSEHLYELREPSEFGLAQSARLQRISAQVRDLGESEDDAALERMAELLTEFCKLVLIAPADVIDAMTLDQRAQVAVAFQAAVMGKRTPITATTDHHLTSGTSSAASAPSTTATVGGTG